MSEDVARKKILLREAKAAEIRASYHDYYGKKTPEYFIEMRLAQKLRELAATRRPTQGREGI